MKQYLETSEVLRRAIRDDVADISFYQETDMLWAMKHLRESKGKKRPYINLDQAPQALQARVHTLGRTPEFNVNQDHLIELARIVVPENNIGYLENIEQYVADKDGQFYASSAEHWGKPYDETVPYGDIVWLFRLQRFNGILPNRFYYTAPVINDYRSLLPGYAWSDLSDFQGLWYPATQMHSFRANVPSAHMLRFYAFVDTAVLETYSWRIVGKLHARVQSSQCNEALFNSRTTFQ